jgi:amino acid transporter
MSVFTVLIIDLEMHIVAVFFCLVFLSVNLIGAKQAARTQVLLVGGVLLLMVLYVVVGLPAVRVERFSPFVPQGAASIFFATGFVFVSYAGLLKIASVAEEIRDPARNIPLGMMLSLLAVSVLYTLMVFVTTGLLEAADLSQSLTPISDGAGILRGSPGEIALGIAAILAFLSTANAGIMTAARSLIPVSHDGLLPAFFGKVNARFGTPHNALMVTGFLVISSLFLKLDILVEAASVVLILTHLLACTSVIILRESRIHNYRPQFCAPLYPWIQILGIVGFGFLIIEMGRDALLISCLLIVAAIFVYWFYGRIRTNREYALLHLIERVTAKELTTYSLESELRDIIRERDDIISDRFDNILEKSFVLDIPEAVSLEQFFHQVADAMSARLKLEPSVLFNLLVQRETETSTVLNPDLAIPHIIINGEGAFEVLLVRARSGISFAPEYPNVHTVFVLVGTKDERNFHLRVLSAIAQIVQDPGFEKKWMTARNEQELRDILLLGSRRREPSSSLFTSALD